jgi:DegV family protein with EDD domain
MEKKMIGIVTDSTCDLPDSVVRELGIEVVPLYINYGSHGLLDGVEISRQEFYERLPNAVPLPTTGTPGTEAFRKAYEILAGSGATEILSIHISSSLSALVDVARAAATQTHSVPVTILDSGQLSLGTGFMVEAAAQAARDGCTLQEIQEMLSKMGRRTHVFAALDTLEFLRRSGRMNGVVAGIGSLLQIKPLLKMHQGTPTSERVRTADKAMDRLVELLQELHPLERVALVHTHANEKASQLYDRVRQWLPEGEIPSVDITPVIGTHIGPGAVGFACISVRQP